MERLSVFIVNYFKADRLAQSVEYLLNQDVSEIIDIFILDNSCDENEHKKLEELRSHANINVIFSERNVGYTKGVNILSNYAKENSHIILMNPDIFLKENSIIRMLVNSLEANNGVGVLATLQRNDDGSYVENARRFPKLETLIFRRLYNKSTDMDIVSEILKNRDNNIHAVDWVQSSFVIIRNCLWNEIKGLNEEYFLFMSDIDLSVRSSATGYLTAVDSAIDGVTADGIRASKGGILGLLSNRALRIHVIDAIKFFINKSQKSQKLTSVA